MPNANWSNPTLTSTYTNFVSEVKNRDEDLALQFDGTTSTNIPTNAIRWDSSAGRWKKWNGSAWAELAATYALTSLTTTGDIVLGQSSSALQSGGTGLTIFGSTSSEIKFLNSTAGNTATDGTALVSSGLGFNINNRENGDIIIGTNNLERLRITSAGLVGIGTSSPGALLDVKVASDAKLLVQDGNTTGNVKFNAVNNAVSANVNLEISASNTQFFNGGTERLRITSAGLVGIGTSSPDTLLHARITGGGGVPATSGTSQPNAAIRIGGSGTTGVLDFGCNSGSPWIQATDRADLSQKYNLLLNPNGGNVGIGTTSPGQKLHVTSGAVRAGTSNSTNGSVIIEGDYSGSDVLNTFGSQFSSGSTTIGYATKPRAGATGFVSSAGNSSFNRAIVDVGENAPFRVLYGPSSTVAIDTVVSLTEAMRVDYNGLLTTSYGISGAVTRSTAVTTTSGTSVSFTSLPTWVKRISIHFSGVSLNGTDHLLVRLSTGGTFAASGYNTVSNYTTAGGATGGVSSTAGFALFAGDTANLLTGTYTFTNITGNTWIGTGGHIYDNDGSFVGHEAGKITLSGTLDGIRLLPTGSNTFDAGTVNITYEG